VAPLRHPGSSLLCLLSGEDRKCPVHGQTSRLTRSGPRTFGRIFLAETAMGAIANCGRSVMMLFSMQSRRTVAHERERPSERKSHAAPRSVPFRLAKCSQIAGSVARFAQLSPPGFWQRNRPKFQVKSKGLRAGSNPSKRGLIIRGRSAIGQAFAVLWSAPNMQGETYDRHWTSGRGARRY
jgi:hypothetical protein